MTALTDKEISKRDLIESIDPNRISSNGYDLLLEDFEIDPGETKLILSKEKVKMPKNLISLPFLRTTYAFKGLHLSQGVIDAGYEGKLKFCLTNPTKETIKTEKEDHLKAPIHLIFLETKGNAELPFGKRKNEFNDFQ